MALKLGNLSGRDFAWGQRVRRWLHSLYLLFIRVSVLGLTLKVKDIGRQTLIRGFESVYGCDAHSFGIQEGNV